MTMPALTSPVNALRVALVAALKTIAALDDGHGDAHVYHEGEVPRGTPSKPAPLPRIVYGAHGQSPRQGRRYGQNGMQGNVMLRCWAEDSWEAEVLFNDALLVLQQPLAVTGHVLPGVLIDRVTDYPDPDPDIDAHVVIARVELPTRQVG